MRASIVAATLIAAGATLGCAGHDALASEKAATTATSISERQAEDLARAFFSSLSEYDEAAIRNMSTAGFEIVENDGKNAMRMNMDAFSKRLKGAQGAGLVLKFELSEFRTTVTRDAAWTFYVETGVAPSNNGRKFLGGQIFKRAGDRWLLDKLFTMPIPQDAASRQSAAN